MDTTRANPLTRVERPKINYPLVVAAFLMCAVLVAGAVLTARSGYIEGAAVFAAAIALFVILMLLDMAARRRIAALDDRKFINWDAAMPEIQRQNVNVEVRELARLLKMGNDQLPDLLSAYIVAEDLALRQIQQEENLPLMRHVSIGKTPFDAILVDQDLITCIEVAFLVVPDVRQEKVESVQKKLILAKKNIESMKSRLRLRLMLVLVTQLTESEEEELGVIVKRRFKELQIDSVEIRMLDFEMLQKLYVSE